jgi:hypothetical protein
MTTEVRRAALHINFVNPPPDWVNPPVCITPYNEFKPFPIRNLGGPIPSGQTREFNSGVLQLDSCPQYLLIFAKLANDIRDSNLQNQIGCTDTFAQIERIRLNYGGRSDLLSQVEPIQLYEMCVANGIKNDWQQFHGVINKGFDGEWIGLTGSVIKLMFAKDIVAGIDFVPGMGTNVQLQVMGTLRNINPYRDMDYELWVFPVMEGVASFNGMTVIKSTTVIPSRDIVQTAPISSSDYTTNERAFGNALNEGGNFLSVLGNVVSALPAVGNIVSGLFGNRQPSQPIQPVQAYPARSAVRPLQPQRRPTGYSRGPVRRRMGRSVMGHGLEGGEIATPEQLGAVSRIY